MERLNIKHIAYIFCLALVMIMTGCTDERKPLNLPPALYLQPAEEITRNSALLQGEIRLQGEDTVKIIRFRYGLTDSVEETAPCDPNELHAATLLTGLQPGRTYYYCLEAGNGYSTVRSETMTFCTQPNVAPTLSGIRLLNQGPLSITLAYDITDNGGERLSATGFYYRQEGDEEEHCVSLSPKEGTTTYQARLAHLQIDTDYEVQAYAINNIGETRSKPYHFHTDKAIIVTTGGMLGEAIGDENKYNFNSLSIAGPLNGTDIGYLRDMMGKDRENNDTPGRLSVLDLRDANIVAGGQSYDGSRYTTDRTISKGMFAQCQYLQQLLLPDGIQTIEEGAFEGCTMLSRLRLPSDLTHFQPSAGCDNLREVEVPASCMRFCTIDGVLYDKSQTALMWYPEGKDDNEFTVPDGVRTIGDYAFRYADIRQIDLSASINSLGQRAFCGSKLEHVVLPNGISILPYGCFQQCRQLKSVALGHETNYLSSYCFDGCPDLRDLYVYATDFAPYCQEAAFTGAESLLSEGTLHVPTDCLTLYRNHKEWGQFTTIIEDAEK